MCLRASLSGFALAILTAVPSAAQDAGIQQDLTAYNDRYNEIVAAYDLEAFLALYNDAPLWIAPETPPVAGLKVPAGAFGFIAENKGEFSHSFDHFFVSDDGSMAVMIGGYDADIEAAGVAAQGTYLFVMQRDDDGWAIVADMFNQHAAE
ncbi:nuclear transport factor 2 family protein [Roseobacter sp.]|uniref:YybH family protein n=1 Tax=Roseobacter sp. TaxID=1907202 RepID=UPI0029666DA7|nr:nuclear transport factor 2 family protein [Roseobacter sp.]MDW3180767.1 nuclear transport factor 2 family protein [Roseobacter sp.]